jgi:hypothetical protein
VHAHCVEKRAGSRESVRAAQPVNMFEMMGQRNSK